MYGSFGRVIRGVDIIQLRTAVREYSAIEVSCLSRNYPRCLALPGGARLLT